MFSRRFLLVLSLTASVAMVGCKSTPKPDKKQKPATKSGMEGYPEWVVKGSGAFSGDRGKAIYGVGARSNISNFARLRNFADNSARMEVASILRTRVNRLVKDYFRSVSDSKNQSEEQVVQEASKSYTDATLSGCEVVDHFYDTARNTMYSLAVLDLDAFKKMTEEAKKLSEEVQAHILKNAESAWDEIPDPQK